MAKFDVNRMGDSTRVNKVDDQHNQTEADAQDIFGIPDNTSITAYIFGKNPENPGGKPIQPDGSIRGVPVLSSDGVQSSASTAVGFKFDDGTVAKLMVYVDSELQIYKDADYPNEDWERVASIETPGTGKIVNLTDYLGPEDLSGDVGKLLKVASDGGGGYGFDLVDPVAGVGVTEFIGLTDGPGDYGTVGQILKSEFSGVVWGDAPVVAAPLILMGYSVSVNGWGSTVSFRDVFNWHLSDPEGSGYVETNEVTYLANDGVDVNKFFKNLPAGPYEISLWYSTEAGIETPQGTREWRIQGTDLHGPAVVGVAARATVGFYGNGAPSPIDGAKYLGTRMFLIGTLTTNLKVQVRQNSGASLGISDEVSFYCVIRKVQ